MNTKLEEFSASLEELERRVEKKDSELYSAKEEFLQIEKEIEKLNEERMDLVDLKDQLEATIND